MDSDKFPEQKELHREEYYEIDLKEYLQLIWEKKWILISFFLIAVISSYVISSYFLTPEYETSARIQLTNMGDKYNIGERYNDSDLAQQIFTSRSFTGDIIQDITEDELSENEIVKHLNNNIIVEKNENSRIMDLTVKNNDPEKAFILGNNILTRYQDESDEFSSEYVDSRREELDLLENDLKDVEERLHSISSNIENVEERDIPPSEKVLIISGLISRQESLNEQKSELRKDLKSLEREIESLNSFNILNSFYEPENPVKPNIKLNMAIAGVLALMLGVFIIFFLEFLKEE
ncbi:MAG: Wzz/FepE/Etk N-terminal domain-containing protein [Bacillota bacterium]